MPSPALETILDTYKQIGKMFLEDDDPVTFRDNVRRRAWQAKVSRARSLIQGTGIPGLLEWREACNRIKEADLRGSPQAALELIVILLATQGIDRRSIVAFSAFVYSDEINHAIDQGFVEHFDCPRLTLRGLAFCAEIGLL